MIEDSKAGRPKGLAPRVGPWVLLALWPAASSAQTSIAPASTRPPRWKLSLGLDGGWDSNVLFSAQNVSGDALTRLVAKLDRTWAGRRGHLALSGEGRGSLYRRVSELDHVTRAGEADALYLVSRRVAVRLRGGVRTGYASEMVSLTEAGLLLPPVLSHANDVQGSVSYAVSRRTTASLDAQREAVSFDSPSLVGGSMLRTGLTLGRELGRADTLALTAQYQRSAALSEHSNTQTLFGSWSRALGPAVRIRVHAGASRYQPLASPAFRTTPVGGAALDARRGPHALEVRYDRSVDLAYGVGRVRINRLVSGQYSLAVTRRLGLDLRAVRSRGRDADESPFVLRSSEAAGGFRFALAPDLAMVGTYTWLRSEQAPSFLLSSHRAMLQVSYERAWR
jgi:hypothetical protein